LSSREWWGDFLLKVIFLGIIVFGIQQYIGHKINPLTSSEILKKENFINSKKEVFYEAIQIINKKLAMGNWSGPDAAKYKTWKGASLTEKEVNDCLSKLYIFSNNKNIPINFAKLFGSKANVSPTVVGRFIKLLRKDLDYGDGEFSVEDEYFYIQIGSELEDNSELFVPDFLFLHDSYVVKDEYIKELNSLGQKLKKYNFKEVQIIGYADDTGNNEYNKQLSIQRAMSIKNYLVRKFQLDSNILRVEGKGESNPIYPNKNDSERIYNRRVEVILKN